MKKREIIKIVNSVQLWEQDSKLLDLLVQDGRLPEHNRINTYKVDVAKGVRMIYYSRDAVVIVYKADDTSEILNYEIYCQDSKENEKANRRK